MKFNILVCLQHWTDFKGDMTNKGFGNDIDTYLKKLSGQRLELFKKAAFGQFHGLPEIGRGALIMHAMWLKEVIGDEELVKAKRFRFEVAGHLVEYGEKEFVLIIRLKYGLYQNILEYRKHGQSSFRSRVFPGLERDADLKLIHLRELMRGELFEMVSDEDAVIVVQIWMLLKSFMGRDPGTYIPPFILSLADDFHRFNRYVFLLISKCFTSAIFNIYVNC